MNIFFTDIKFGNFVASEHNLFPISFDTSVGNEEIDLAMGSETKEEYLGNKTVPLDYGSDHHGKLEFTITFSKNNCNTATDEREFNTFEIRSILRELTGNQYYKELYFIDDKLHFDERVHYRVKVTDTKAHKIGSKIVAIGVTFQNDSFWSYADKNTILLDLKAGQNFYFYNSSDELNDYLYPTVEISNASGDIVITNVSDNNRETVIENIASDEIVTLDAKNEIISSSIVDKNIVDDFNLKWVRFIPGKNELLVSSDCTLKITYQLLRKVVF